MPPSAEPIARSYSIASVRADGIGPRALLPVSHENESQTALRLDGFRDGESELAPVWVDHSSNPRTSGVAHSGCSGNVLPGVAVDVTFLLTRHTRCLSEDSRKTTGRAHEALSRHRKVRIHSGTPGIQMSCSFRKLAYVVQCHQPKTRTVQAFQTMKLWLHRDIISLMRCISHSGYCTKPLRSLVLLNVRGACDLASCPRSAIHQQLNARAHSPSFASPMR